MTSLEFKEARHSLGVSQSEFGRRIGKSLRTIAGYEAGDRPIDLTTQLAVKLVLQSQEAARCYAPYPPKVTEAMVMAMFLNLRLDADRRLGRDDAKAAIEAALSAAPKE
jgi:transcriptional regulator with XRE-family HTH domain